MTAIAFERVSGLMMLIGLPIGILLNASSSSVQRPQRTGLRTQPSQDIETKERCLENMANRILPLELIDKAIGSQIWILMRGSKEIVGNLRGFDDYVSLYLLVLAFLALDVVCLERPISLKDCVCLLYPNTLPFYHYRFQCCRSGQFGTR
jgi:LSM domain